MKKFPLDCVCDSPGQCSYTGREMTPGMFMECQANSDFRCMLAKLPMNQWPDKKTKKTPKAKQIVAAKVPVKILRPGNCEHLGAVIDRRNSSGNDVTCVSKQLSACSIYGSCRIGTTCQTCDDYSPDIADEQITQRENMSVVEFVRTIKKHEPRTPELLKWDVSHRALQALLRNTMAACPPVPSEIAGNGLITCGGGKYDACAYVCISMIRHYGCQLPIEIWYTNSQPVSQSILKLPNVIARCLDDIKGLRVNNGWATKTVAMTHTSFAKFMFIDADAYPVQNVDRIFEQFNKPVMIFPDRTFADGWINWPSYGIAERPDYAPPPISGGHYLFDTVKAWPVLQTAFHLDQYSDFWYEKDNGWGGYGDQDQMRAAITLTQTEWQTLWHECHYERNGIFTYFDEKGDLLFVHRAGGKFAYPQVFGTQPKLKTHLKDETVAWKYFNNWKRLNPMSRRPRHTPYGGCQ